jgi:4'-phosphopantetheinyl transferase
MPINLETPKPEETLKWVPRRTALPLETGVIHLWRIPTRGRGDIEDPELAAELDLLGVEQRARAQRMTHGTPRQRYIRAQAGLRRILGLYVDAACPSSLTFRYGSAGKPMLDGGPPDLQFNLTTAGDLALLGICLGSPLGVDCEHIRPRQGLIDIARRMFEPTQAETIAALPEDAALVAFYRCWTALEADAKSDGRGLFRPRPSGLKPPEVRHCIPGPGFVAAVARDRVPPVRCWKTLELADAPSD